MGLEVPMVNVEEALAHVEGSGVEAPVISPVATKLDHMTLALADKIERRKRQMEMAALFAQGQHISLIAKKFGLTEVHIRREVNDLIHSFEQQAQQSIGTLIAQEDAILYMVQLEAINAWFASQEGRLTHVRKQDRKIRSVHHALHEVGGKKARNGNNHMTQEQVEAQTQSELEMIFSDDPQPMLDDPHWQVRKRLEREGQEALKEDTHEETMETHQSSPGDPRFLRIILDCHDRRVRLHGLVKGDQEANKTLEEEIGTMSGSKRADLLRNFLDKARQRKAQQLALQPGSVSVEKMNGQPLNSQTPSAEDAFTPDPPKTKFFEVQARKVTTEF